MNFDDIKSAWHQEPSSDWREITVNDLYGKHAAHPIARLRKNLRFELYAQGVGVLVLGFFPQLFGMGGGLYLYYYLLYALVILLSVYYISRISVFYKQVLHYEVNSRESLLRLYYELRLYIEVYKSFMIALYPFALVMIVLVEFDAMPAIKDKLLWVIFVGVFFTVMLILATILWIREFYGKYATMLLILLKELDEEPL
ncbi:hypothetical protein KTO58_16335 [Chitinophaga pendula]|uniref:hypothetical protein n=1 Tax=Chitinophaga TaxID=79328 RepID=UPI000BAEBD73|nr:MULTISPECIES: hypothetical protein [Chitinophaga]ASZ11719.1 hypothetical protein CK934_12510 [Chitinophaga sp. MD30]UCJ05261.1 hypothetical protein KTO58_16335 [Chitinophaga pendula]